MKTRDLLQIYDPRQGRFLRTGWRSVGLDMATAHAIRRYEWVPDRYDADMWPKSVWRRYFLSETVTCPLARPDVFQAVPAPRCGCCGVSAQLNRYDLVLVVDGPLEDHQWRCEKHRGRVPCLVEGCGRTWAQENYDAELICGKHWKLAPRFMRDRLHKIRKRAKRVGWTPRLGRMDAAAWRRIVAAVLRRLEDDPALDFAAIEREFGFDPRE